MQVISCNEAKLAGLKRFFTGVPCKNGHVAERSIHGRNCLQCIQENQEATNEKKRLRRQINKPRLLAREAVYRALNRDKYRETRKKSYYANRDTILERSRKANLDNPALSRKRAKKFYDGHRDICAERNRAQRLAKPDQYRAYVQQRRARLAGASGKYNASDIEQIRKMQRNRCAFCRISLDKVEEHVDHIMPLALGGSNDRTNIQILCEPCNLQKWKHHPIDHARSRGLLL